MTVQKLSKRTVDALPPMEKRYAVYDDTLKGFAVRVMPTGAKTWVVEYRAQSGGRRAGKKRLSLGRTTAVTPDEARKRARDLLAEVRLGGDPAAERTTQRTSLTVSELLRLYHAEYVIPKLKPGSVQLYHHLLFNILAPALGNIKARDLTRGAVERLHIANGERRPTSANRALAVLSGCYHWAASRSLVPEGLNPAKNIKKFRENARERYLSAEEFERLGAAIREAETVGIAWPIPVGSRSKHRRKDHNCKTVIPTHVAAAFRLLLLTGARLREILNLRWDEVDLERGLLRLRDSKTGAKAIVLNSWAVQLLAGLHQLSSFVIAGDRLETARSDLKRPWSLISTRAGLKGVRIHDLRHSFASVGAGFGLGLPIVGKLLGHAQASTTERYAHLDNDPLRRATEQIGDHIMSSLNRGQTNGGRRSSLNNGSLGSNMR